MAYLTTAVKCGKTGYAVASGTIEECSAPLERKLALFPRARVLMLMGDVAIKAANTIARRGDLQDPCGDVPPGIGHGSSSRSLPRA